jgi:hypothetical protein
MLEVFPGSCQTDLIIVIKSGDGLSEELQTWSARKLLEFQATVQL